MFIESNARKPIMKAIQIEKNITEYENKERNKGKIILDSEEYNKLRGKFVEICGKINSVANCDGKGRDDLTIDILIAAEQASRKVTCIQSNAVRKLADQIKKSFVSLRNLMQKYEKNIEAVDPQLKNNSDLVELLMDFESSWEKGKDYFIKASTLNDLISFSQLIEGMAEKYESVRNQIDTMETDLFMSLPKVLILKCIDEHNYSLLKYFNPSLDYSEGEKLEELQQLYDTIECESGEYDCYNYLEEALLEVSHATELAPSIIIYANKFIQLTKIVSMGIQRFNASEWNSFLMTSLGNVCASKSM